MKSFPALSHNHEAMFETVRCAVSVFDCQPCFNRKTEKGECSVETPPTRPASYVRPVVLQQTDTMSFAVCTR